MGPSPHHAGNSRDYWLARSVSLSVLVTDTAPVETLFFHVGSRQSGFVLRPDEFVRAFWQSGEQLTIHLGESAMTVMVQGELGEALSRRPGADD